MKFVASVCAFFALVLAVRSASAVFGGGCLFENPREARVAAQRAEIGVVQRGVADRKKRPKPAAESCHVLTCQEGNGPNCTPADYSVCSC
ncbi:MAG: hypothetical protein EHM68_07900 [Lysobacterales bacterium]|nr:MAG: hypothetical protein EHM68_07900 [Xanthomonadales bacterium]